jgi:FixJ family two-component response regulator
MVGGCQGRIGTEKSSKMAEVKPVVFVVDDDVSVRASLKAFLEGSGFEVRAFDCAEAFLAAPRALGPCCLVLEVSLPEVSGLDLQILIARERAEMPVIFMTGHADIPMTVRAMKAGAVEFLTKPYAEHTLLEGVKAAIERSRMILAKQLGLQPIQERYATLTPREREVMALVVSGLSNKQVGARLGITEITVKAHRGRVMEKMQVGSLAELVRIGSRLGLGSSETMAA